MNTQEWIQHIGTEIEEPLRFFYSQQAYGDCLRASKGIEQVNKNVHFWKVFSVSVQRSLFISLGRLFDGVEGARSFPKFQGYCMQNVSEFQKTAIESRRIISNGGRKPDYLDSFLEGCCEVTNDKLGKMFSPVSSVNENARNIYQRIRSKTFAHAIWTKEEEYSELFGLANNNEIERILLTLWAVHQNLWQLYYNGRYPEKEYLILNYKYKEELYDAIKKAFYDNPIKSKDKLILSPFISV